MLNKVKEALLKCPEDGSIYLIEKLSDISGFFATKKHLLYMVFNNEGLSHQNLSTEFLRLNTNIEVVSIENNQQFSSGKYNVLEIVPVDGKYDEEYVSSFINMCIAHTEYMNASAFLKYFYSLVNLFQYPKEQKFINLIGLVGELFFLKYAVDELGHDLSECWHNSGSTDKYDIALKKCNVEIKTTMAADELITVKHMQLFNDDNNFLVSVLLEESNAGVSLNQLLKMLQNYPNAFKSFNFALNTEKEKRRISPVDAETKKFSLKTVSIYDADVINPFASVPQNVSGLIYKLDLTDKDQISISDFEKELNCE